jgi:predicted metal-dependent hydrolase
VTPPGRSWNEANLSEKPAVRLLRQLRVSEPTVLVQEQQKRRASCHPEIVHLVHDDHGSAFWRQLGRVMPDYEDRRRELRRVGARFEW